MSARAAGISLAIDPALAEAAVEDRLQGPSDLLQKRMLLEFRRAADRIYQGTPARDREAAFRDLYGSLFSRLGYERSLTQSLREFPALHDAVCALVVVRAGRAAEEGTDLSGRPRSELGPRRAILRIRPERFLDEAGLRAFLRFNWIQLGDLTDPRFGYEGGDLPGELSPAEARLMLEAYGLVWALYTDARMRRRWAGPSASVDMASAVARLVGRAGPETAQAILDRVTGPEVLTHQELLANAAHLRAAARRGQSRAIETCALCRFASADVQPLDEVPEPARTAVAQEYPAAEGGVCGHCLERLVILSRCELAR